MASKDEIFLDTDVALGISAIVTRNKGDYFPSEIPVFSPEEFLANRESAVE
jgi:hypothetical protein